MDLELQTHVIAGNRTVHAEPKQTCETVPTIRKQVGRRTKSRVGASSGRTQYFDCETRASRQGIASLLFPLYPCRPTYTTPVVLSSPSCGVARTMIIQENVAKAMYERMSYYRWSINKWVQAPCNAVTCVLNRALLLVVVRLKSVDDAKK